MGASFARFSRSLACRLLYYVPPWGTTIGLSGKRGVSETKPQTKTEITELLKAEGFRPNRRRGQNFLIDGNLMRLVVETAELTKDDVAFEVGTGTGSLTRMLAAVAGEVVTVEVDPILQRVGADVLAGLDNVTRIEGDVLEDKHHFSAAVLDALGAAAARRRRVKLVANLPYSVATPIVMNIVIGNIEFERLVFTVQREVAERLTAAPGSDAYGWVSVVMALAGAGKVLRRLKPSVFWPRPGVESALVAYRPTPGWKTGLDIMRVRKVGMFVFQQRRKMAVRIMRDYLAREGSPMAPEGVLLAANIAPTARGHCLTAQEIRRLSEIVP